MFDFMDNEWMPWIALGGVALYFLYAREGSVGGSEKKIETYKGRSEELASQADRYKKLASKMEEIEKAKESVNRLKSEMKEM